MNYSYTDILNMIANYIFMDCSTVGETSLAQVHCLINLLVNANIGFVVTFNPGTTSTAKYIAFQVYLSPSTTITKNFQFNEGFLSSET